MYSNMKIILSLCENSNSKISKNKSFENLHNSFKNDEFYILGDNLNKDLEEYLLTFNLTFYENKLRGRHQYFIDKLEFCINNFHDDDTLYLVEDDYIHIEDCSMLLDEGLQYADYVTLYDHPDKYIQCQYPNPEVKDIGEQTILFRTNNSHWKYTNSTTGTFSCKKKTIKDDIDIWLKLYKNTDIIAWDYFSFKDLRFLKNRKIASCIPGRSSHIHSKEMLSPFFKHSYDSLV